MNDMNDNLNDILSNIKNICTEKGRDYNEVILIAVTKTIDLPRIKEVIKLGINNIGENKVQEITEKYESIKDISKIHMIGHLQSNKVKYIIDKVELIHSVDSISLMKEINKRAAKAGLIANVLIQVNVADEESKFGIKINEIESFLNTVKQFNNVHVRGLMTIAPYAENPDDIRFVFKALKEKFDEIKSSDYKNVKMEYLSMGMTNDYRVALEEGANMLRIGTKIFGKRLYNR